MRAIAVGVALACLLAGTRGAVAGPSDELNDARALVRAGRYKEAIPKLNYLLYPRARLAGRADLAEAHVLLGVSYFETGKQAEAEDEFERALFLDRSLALDELLFSKKVIGFFDAIRKKIEADTARARLTAKEARLAQMLAEAISETKNSRAVSFIPFGVGQFQNDHNRKGTMFAISQAVTGGLSAGIWLWQVLKYGLNGAVPVDDAGTVRRLQQVQIASGGLCLALMVWGLIDAQWYFQPSKLRRGIDRSRIDELKKLLEADQPKPRSFNLLPMVSPNGGGLALTWEF